MEATGDIREVAGLFHYGEEGEYVKGEKASGRILILTSG